MMQYSAFSTNGTPTIIPERPVNAHCPYAILVSLIGCMHSPKLGDIKEKCNDGYDQLQNIVRYANGVFPADGVVR